MMLKAQRDFSADFRGPVYIWDLDKTYLNTRFSQMRHLLRIPFELGVDKRAVPGTPELLHALRDGAEGAAQNPIFFVSASPHQLSTSVERKMLLDGIQFDGIVFKDATNLLMKGRFDQLRFQVAYKVAALIALADLLPVGAQLHLFGDDVEDDALIYCLFADLISGRLSGDALYRALGHSGVQRNDAKAIVKQSEYLTKREAVSGIYIRLVRAAGGERVQNFGPRVFGWQTPVALLDVFRGLDQVSPRNCEAVNAAAEPSEGVLGGAILSPEGFWTPSEYRRNPPISS